jgi:peptide/nickel transport system permease protein
MIQENRVGLVSNLWGVLAPTILLAVLAVGVNTFSDGIARANISGDESGDPGLAVVSAEAIDADVSDQPVSAGTYEV